MASDIQAQSRHPLPMRSRRAAGALDGAATLALTWRDARRSAAVLLVAALLLLAADVLLLWLHPGTYTIDIGTYRDSFFIGNANGRESTPDGTTYRWSA